MKTVLLSTSSLWNCGDDFIRLGLLELLQLRPDVGVIWWNQGYGIRNAYANDLDLNLSLMDYFVVAGKPQWIYKNEKIYRYCLDNQIPLSIVGVGTRNVQSNSQVKLMKDVANSGLCEAAFARDKYALAALKDFGFENARLILDPAFFMQPLDIDPEKASLNILGWREQFRVNYDPGFFFRFPLKFILGQIRTIQTSGRTSKLRQEYDELMLGIFSSMPEPKLVIVHDNREVSKAENMFGSEYVFYSTEYWDIFKKYARTHRYIGSRIHGATPSLIHGASVSLIYTNKKAQVLENAKAILSNYGRDIIDEIDVRYFGEESIDLESIVERFVHPSSNEMLQEAIRCEKQELRSVLLETPILSQFMS
jgi:polysaccharide pyruvyl transferase WcaK-like protein